MDTSSSSNEATIERPGPTEGHVQPFAEVLDGVQRWVEDRDYKGYDPGDGLTSWLRPLTMKNKFAERVLQQLIWKSPVNVRPFVGIKPMDSTKGRGFMAWGYLFRYKATRDVAYLQKARQCLEWLDQHSVTTYPGKSWANHFDFTTRSGTMPAGEPTIVWSGLIGQAFLEAFEQTQDQYFLDIAQGICEWILQVPRHQTDSGTCLSYVAYGGSWIHNSNLLGAGMLSKTWKLGQKKKDEYLEVAREAVKYTCSAQLDDGAWYYGEEEKYHWIDNFHTAYNLDCLKRFLEATGENEYQPNLDIGYAYFKDTFFEDSGLPRYYHDKTMPIDIQCAGQAIDTFAFFSDVDPEALSRAEKVARWTIENMRDESGYFYYRLLGKLKVKTPYFHWGQSTMFKALSHLSERLSSNSSSNSNSNSSSNSSPSEAR